MVNRFERLAYGAEGCMFKTGFGDLVTGNSLSQPSKHGYLFRIREGLGNARRKWNQLCLSHTMPKIRCASNPNCLLKLWETFIFFIF